LPENIKEKFEKDNFVASPNLPIDTDDYICEFEFLDHTIILKIAESDNLLDTAKSYFINYNIMDTVEIFPGISEMELDEELKNENNRTIRKSKIKNT
jgi:hypothetical protein